MRKARTINLLKPVKARKLPVVSGRCRVCGCTEERACGLGCEWVDAAHTICSACGSNIGGCCGINAAVAVCTGWEKSELHGHLEAGRAPGKLFTLRYVLYVPPPKVRNPGPRDWHFIYALVSRRPDDPWMTAETRRTASVFVEAYGIGRSDYLKPVATGKEALAYGL